MKKRDLNDILREVNKEGVKEPETIRKYIRTLGNRTLYSLMYGDKERCTEEERYECWSYLEFVLLEYTCFLDFTDDEIEYCMKHITFKDFLCLTDHLNDENKVPEDSGEEGVGRNDLGLGDMRETALVYLLRLMLRAKGRRDKDVNNFFMIYADNMFDLAEGNAGRTIPAKEEVSDNEVAARKTVESGKREEKKLKIILDYFYLIKDRLDSPNFSWTSLNTGRWNIELGCLRELLMISMGCVGFFEEFSLPETLYGCEMMCKKR